MIYLDMRKPLPKDVDKLSIKPLEEMKVTPDQLQWEWRPLLPPLFNIPSLNKSCIITPYVFALEVLLVTPTTIIPINDIPMLYTLLLEVVLSKWIRETKRVGFKGINKYNWRVYPTAHIPMIAFRLISHARRVVFVCVFRVAWIALRQ